MRNASPPGRIASLLHRRKSVPTSRPPRRRRGALLTLAVAVAAAAAAVPIVSASASSSGTYLASRDGLGIQPGKIKHVWLIILENKSYDATFTGLNNNTYLWQTLPSQGVLLKNYYGTGHFSLDNYISLVSGQATQPDTQADCPYYDKFSGTVDTSGLAARPTRTTARWPQPRARTPRPARTAASTRRACRRCSTSSTPPT